MVNYKATAPKLTDFAPLPTSNKGLCETCVHDHDCAFQKKPGGPVFFCEEFDSQGAILTAADQTGKSAQPEARSIPLYTGLCINCDDAATCVFPQKGAGGWFCEEYV
ncbi:MAG: hypothetical protein ABH878_01915 [bacterium]